MDNRYILSIDDSAIVRRIIKDTVEMLNLDFLEAEEGNDGIEMLKKYGRSIKLILLDWNMPGMSGIEFLKIAKSDLIYKDIPIFMVTTEGEKANVLKAIQIGADGYVLKPFNKEELAKKIKAQLRGV